MGKNYGHQNHKKLRNEKPREKSNKPIRGKVREVPRQKSYKFRGHRTPEAMEMVRKLDELESKKAMWIHRKATRHKLPEAFYDGNIAKLDSQIDALVDRLEKGGS